MPSHDPPSPDGEPSPSPSAARRRAQPDLPFLEAYLANIVTLSEDAIISVGVDQRIRLFNRRAEAIFGYSEPEMLGQPLDLLVPERFRAVTAQDQSCATSHGVPRGKRMPLEDRNPRSGARITA